MTRVIALLSWFDEEPDILAACVASLNGVCDHVVALDGAYMLYPGALTAPQSDELQARTILAAARGARLGVTIHSPRHPWFENEVEKRTALFRYGLLEATHHHDWFLCIDADEAVTRAPGDLREQLGDAEGFDVAGVTFTQREQLGAGAPGPREGSWPGHRVLFRALPDLRVSVAHYFYLAGPEEDARILRGRYDIHDLEPAFDASGLVIRHRPHFRPSSRMAAKERYYGERDRLLIERPVIGSKLERVDGGQTLFNAHGERERIVE